MATILLTSFLLLPNSSAMVLDEAYLGSSPGRFNSIKISDIDADGNEELIFGNYEGYLNVVGWKGSEFRPEWHIGPLGQRLWGIQVADLESDGTLEILAGDGDGNLWVYNSTTMERRYEVNELIRDVHGITLGDADNDGEDELVTGGGYKMDHPWGMMYTFYPANGTLKNSFLPGNASRIRAIVIADIDGDSYNELIFGTGVSLGETPGEGYICVYQYDGSNYTREWISEDLDGDVVSIEVLDVDGDGNLEIVASNGYREGPGYAFIFRYVGAGGEGSPPLFERVWASENIGPKPYGLGVGDIDSDGINEIVIGNRAGYIWVFDGSSRAIEWKSPLLGSDILGLTLGDVDGDGQIEIVAAQGGYQGKADFTSAYTSPHIYILDGTKHTIEFALGGRDYTSWTLQIIIVMLLIVLLVGVNVYFSWKRKKRAEVKSK